MSDLFAPPTPPAPAGTSPDGARLAPPGASAVRASEPSSPPASAPLGLSQRHISPTPAAKPRRSAWAVEIAVGGRCAKLLAPQRGSCIRKRAQKKRGTIRGFSKPSRRRLLTYLNSLHQQREGLPLFLTLTYPGGERWNQLGRAEYKRHLDGLLKRLRRFCPAAHGVWKLEPQKRGAPHYHLLVWGTPYLDIDDVSRLWWEVVGSGDAANLKNGVHLRKANSWRGVAHYAAKYVAKVVDHLPENWTEPGRWWGAFNRRAFTREAETVRISKRAALRLLRLGARRVFGRDRLALLSFLSNQNVGLTVFADEAAVRKAIEWATTPRWRPGLIRPGESAWYRRRAITASAIRPSTNRQATQANATSSL